MGKSLSPLETGVRHVKISSPAYRMLTGRGYGAGAGVGLRPQSGACDSRRRQQRYYESFSYGAPETAAAVPRPRSDSRDGRQSPEYCRDNLFRHCYGQVLRPSRMRRRYATRTLLLLAPEAAPDEDSHPPLSHP